MWTYEDFAAGAEVVSYFRWRQAPFAQEQMHEALLLRNSEPNEAYQVVAEVAQELERLDLHVATERSAVALLFDYESAWAWKLQPQGCDFSYFELVLSFYRGLRRLGLSVDIAPPTQEAMRDRKLILAPGLFTTHDELADAMASSGAVVLLGPRSGSKTPDFQIPESLPPGAFRALIDIAVRRVESLRPGVAVAVDGAPAGGFEGWREILSLGEKAEAILRTQDGQVALARQRSCSYLAGWPNEALLDAILRPLAALANLEVLELPSDIRIRDNGATRFAFNYGDEAADISALIGDAKLILGEPRLARCGVAAFTRGPK
jgi:beta-galactosidase